jgi:hypothetical protein
MTYGALDGPLTDPGGDQEDPAETPDDDDVPERPTGPGSQRARMSMRAWETQTAAARRAAEQDGTRD